MYHNHQKKRISMSTKLIKNTPTIQNANFYMFATTRQMRNTHNHTYKEIAYVHSGKCKHTLNGIQTILSEGDFVILDNTTSHSYNAIGSKSLSIINCLFFPSFIDSSLNDDADMLDVLENKLLNFKRELFIKNPVGTYFKDENGEIIKLLSAINEEFINKNTGYIEAIRGYLVLLLIKTMRTIYTDVKINTGDDTIENILQYVMLNYMNNITLQDICKKYNYTVQYMSYKFKREAGMSFMEFLHKTRIENSMKLLFDTKNSVSEIATAVGYKDIKAFYKFFKKYTDTTPAEFRKNTKKFVKYDYKFAKKHSN